MNKSDFKIEKVTIDSSEHPDRGFTFKISHLKDPHKADALVEIFKDKEEIRWFLFPSYKIYNIAAHFSDIVTGEINKNDSGYKMAAWTGF